MASISVFVFVMIAVIVCGGTTESLLKRDEGERPCDTAFMSCLKKDINEAYIMPVKRPDGSLVFPTDFFTRACKYYTAISDCYRNLTLANCEQGFKNPIKDKSKLMSTYLCRNTDAMNTLVPCLNDKEFHEAYMRAAEYEGAEKEKDCNAAKEKTRRILRLFKNGCGETEYRNLKSVLEDFGEDLKTVFFDIEDPSCNLDVNTLIPDRRRWAVGSAAAKSLMDGWIL